MPTHKPSCPPEHRLLLARAQAARRAIRQGADPYLMLAHVVWPTDKVQAATDQARRAA